MVQWVGGFSGIVVLILCDYIHICCNELFIVKIFKIWFNSYSEFHFIFAIQFSDMYAIYQILRLIKVFRSTKRTTYVASYRTVLICGQNKLRSKFWPSLKTYKQTNKITHCVMASYSYLQLTVSFLFWVLLFWPRTFVLILVATHSSTDYGRLVRTFFNNIPNIFCWLGQTGKINCEGFGVFLVVNTLFSNSVTVHP